MSRYCLDTSAYARFRAGDSRDLAGGDSTLAVELVAEAIG